MDDAREPTEESEPEGPPLGGRQFSSALDSLVREYAGAAANISSHDCKGCELCASCMFCEGCSACYRCNYCTRCTDCSNCNQCDRSSNCHSCTHCAECERCVGSAYLVLCTSCSDCSYCFGCVGLQKKDFHILNVQYDRSTYFKLVKQLKRELGIK